MFSELVPEPPLPPLPPKITFGADVFNPKLAVGIAGFIKRSLVRRPPYKIYIHEISRNFRIYFFINKEEATTKKINK